MGLLVGRIATGILIDRIHAPLVAAVFFAGGALGILLLRAGGDYGTLLLATTLIGLTIGAEGDLISYRCVPTSACAPSAPCSASPSRATASAP